MQNSKVEMPRPKSWRTWEVCREGGARVRLTQIAAFFHLPVYDNLPRPITPQKLDQGVVVMCNNVDP